MNRETIMLLVGIGIGFFSSVVFEVVLFEIRIRQLRRRTEVLIDKMEMNKALIETEGKDG